MTFEKWTKILKIVVLIALLIVLAITILVIGGYVEPPGGPRMSPGPGKDNLTEWERRIREGK